MKVHAQFVVNRSVYNSMERNEKMKNRLPVNRWDTNTEFNLTPRVISEPGFRRFSKACVEKLNSLKEKIIAEMTFRFEGTLSLEMIRRAVNEADAIAAS